MGKKKTSKKKIKKTKLRVKFPYLGGLVIGLVLAVSAEMWLENSGKVKFANILEEDRSQVLAAQTSEVDEQVESIRREIGFWEEVVEVQPSYVDGLVRLSVYHWQLKEETRSREYLARAREIDPNSELVVMVEKAIGY